MMEPLEGATSPFAALAGGRNGSGNGAPAGTGGGGAGVVPALGVVLEASLGVAERVPETQLRGRLHVPAHVAFGPGHSACNALCGAL